MSPLTTKTLYYESLSSTNDELARLASEGASEGLCVVADEQTAGRGRLQRTWSSPKGAGLYFSVLLRPEIPLHYWSLLSFVAALSVGDALLETFDLTTTIKWPNDLLAGERKICGILSESVETPHGRAAIVGIGINLTSEAYPPDLRNVATSVAEETTRPPERSSLLQSLQNALGRWYSMLQTNSNYDEVLQAWISRSPYAHGKIVEVMSGEESFRGVTCGLEQDGALRVETEAREIRIVRAGDVKIRSVSQS